jgi:hypothetical protein
MKLPDQFEDLIRIGRIEVSGRFVGQQQPRPRGKCPSHGHPLLLASRKLIREMVDSMTQSDRFQKLLGAISRPPRAMASDAQREANVVTRIQFIEQMMMLEHETDELVSETRTLFAVEVVHLVTVELQGAGFRTVEQANQMEQGALADAGGPDDRQQLATRDLEVQITKNVDSRRARAVALCQRFEADHGHSTEHADPAIG